MIRFCLFDVYGTLFSNEGLFRNTAERLSQVIPSMHADDLEIEVQKLYHQVFERIFQQENAFESERTMYRQVYAILQENYQIRIDVSKWMDQMYEDFASKPIYPDTFDTLQEFREKGCTITFLSNIDQAPLKGLLARYPDLPYDYAVSSEEARCYKPHPGIFNRALSLMNASVEETVMVGDNYRADIQGGKALGMKTVWINRYSPHQSPSEDHPDADLRIHTLAEMVEWMERKR
jgi:2-haloalkanoic acid dehalogenase type II